MRRQLRRFQLAPHGILRPRALRRCAQEDKVCSSVPPPGPAFVPPPSTPPLWRVFAIHPLWRWRGDPVPWQDGDSGSTGGGSAADKKHRRTGRIIMSTEGKNIASARRFRAARSLWDWARRPPSWPEAALPAARRKAPRRRKRRKRLRCSRRQQHVERNQRPEARHHPSRRRDPGREAGNQGRRLRHRGQRRGRHERGRGGLARRRQGGRA